MDLIFFLHLTLNNNNNEKRTLNALFKRTRIWTHRWIYERFVSYEPLCFKRVIFVQNERKIELNFFWKKTWDFYSFPLLGQQFWLARGFWRRKKWKRWPRSARILLLSSFVLAVFAEENSWSRSLKKGAKKRVCGCFLFCIYTRESGTRIPQSALRVVLRIIKYEY